ncbi:MAG: hypothetical protein KDK08_16470 [Rhizobiaceae bacterium]|nr:hypothetical protein [Rhizobiaceae bacterium]
MLFFGRLLGYGLLFILALHLISITPQMVRLAIATLDTSPTVGNPPYARDVRKLSIASKAALRRFPDGSWCLSSGRGQWNTSPPEKTLQFFAWSEIHNDSEASVCLFYALKKLGSIESAERWFKSQGFRVSRGRAGTPSELKFDRIDAGWLVHPNGHKFRGRSLLSQIRPDFAWAMNIVAHWCPITGELLGVGVNYTFE